MEKSRRKEQVSETSQLKASSNQQRELEQIMASLEADNTKLEGNLRKMYSTSKKSMTDKNTKEKRIEHQQLLDEHNALLEIQLQKLRILLKQVHDEEFRRSAK